MSSQRNSVILNEFTTLSSDLITLELKGSFANYLQLGESLLESEGAVIRSYVDKRNKVYILCFLTSEQQCAEVKNKAKVHNFTRGNMPERYVKQLARMTKEKERVMGFLTPYSCFLKTA